MKIKYSLITLPLSALIGSLAAPAHAAFSVDARGMAMGGTGTVSASYLTAPFYNPALAAIYRRDDDVGFLLPAAGGSYSDPYNMLSAIDEVTQLIDNNEFFTADEKLQELDGHRINVDLGVGTAVGIPNSYLSATLYAKANTESFVMPRVNGSNVSQRLQNTIVESVTVGITELGISLAKYSTTFGQHLSFGVTPKIQRVYTFSYATALTNYDFKINDLMDNQTVKTAFNADAGMLWFYGPVRIGVAGKDLIKQEIQTKEYELTAGSKTWQLGHQYNIEPVYTVGVGYVADYFTFSVDYDINEKTRLQDYSGDDVQMLRAGVELDIFHQMQLRAGYMINLAQDEDNKTLTAGLGFSPLQLFEIDIAGQYTNENAMGVYMNLLAKY